MKPNEADPWDRASWGGARRAVLREGSEMSFPQRLDWLESAHRLAERIVGEGRTLDSAPAAKDGDGSE